MKRLIFSLILIPIILTAQDLEIFGYLESQFMGANIDDSFIQLQNNKLRLDLRSDLSDQLTIAANYNWTTYHGKTEWQIPDYLPENVLTEIPMGLESFMVLPFENTQNLDNAYIKWALPGCDLTLGKQQLSFGAGYAWNPTDLLNTKDLLDPTYEQPGHNAVRLDIPLADRVNTSIVYSPEDTWEQSSKLINIKMGISRFDISLITVEKQWTLHDYTQFNNNLMAPDFLANTDKRQTVGGSIVGELLSWGIWTEAGYNKMETSDNFTEWLIGLDHTFDFQTYVMIEYYQNTQGKTGSDQYNLNDWMRYLAAEQRALSQDQLYAFIQHPVTDLIQVGLSTIVSVSDGSIALLPTLNWTPLENMEILTYINLYQGDAMDSYNSKLGNGGMIRARVYF